MGDEPLPRDCGPPAPIFFLPISPAPKSVIFHSGVRFLHRRIGNTQRNDPKTAKKSGKGGPCIEKDPALDRNP